MNNDVRVDYGTSPQLKAQLAGKEPGDEVTVTITFTAKSVSPESIAGVITEIEVEEPENEGAGEEAGPVKPTAEEPAMVSVMRGGMMKGEEAGAGMMAE